MEASTSTGPVREVPMEIPERVVTTLESLSSIEGTCSILSYNVLSQRYIFSKYPSCPDWALDSLYRRQLILREIKNLSPNIACLQEVDESCYDFLAAHLDEMCYKVYFMKKDGLGEGCLTAFHSDTLDYVDHIEMNFSKLAREKFPNPSTRALYEKPNIAIIMKLRWKKDGTFIFVSNCHLCAGDDGASFFQGATLLETLEQITDPTDAIVLCGDFNSVPDSLLHQLITGERGLAINPIGHEGKKIIRDIPRELIMRQKLQTLESAYKSFLGLYPSDSKVKVGKHMRQGEPLMLYSQKWRITVDYIFFSVNTLQCVGILECPDKDKVIHGDSPLLPSALWPSDHIPLMALFLPLQVGQQSLPDPIPTTDGTRTNANIVSMSQPWPSSTQNMNRADFFQHSPPPTRLSTLVPPSLPLHLPVYPAFFQQGPPYTQIPPTRLSTLVQPRLPLRLPVYPQFFQQGPPYTQIPRRSQPYPYPLYGSYAGSAGYPTRPLNFQTDSLHTFQPPPTRLSTLVPPRLPLRLPVYPPFFQQLHSPAYSQCMDDSLGLPCDMNIRAPNARQPRNQFP